jgi:hypothetical protein
MKMIAVVASLVVVMAAGAANAQGRPSSAKLGRLGLSSMKVVSDQRGEEVRGRGFGAGFFRFTATVTEGVFVNGAFVNNTPANSMTGSAAIGFTWGQDPRANAGAVVAGSGGINPVTPGSPVTLNLATPNGVWTASGFGIGFGNGN